MGGYLVSMLFTGAVFFFFKQKTAYEMRISDWSSDVCSSDLTGTPAVGRDPQRRHAGAVERARWPRRGVDAVVHCTSAKPVGLQAAARGERTALRSAASGRRSERPARPVLDQWTAALNDAT